MFSAKRTLCCFCIAAGMAVTPMLGEVPDQLMQITSTAVTSYQASLEGGTIAFVSDADLAGGNADGSGEVFYWDGSSITQVTSLPAGGQVDAPGPEGGSVAFHTSAALTGANGDLTDHFGYVPFEIPELGRWHDRVHVQRQSDGWQRGPQRGNLFVGRSVDHSGHIIDHR